MWNAFNYTCIFIPQIVDCDDPTADKVSLNNTGKKYATYDVVTYQCAANYNTLTGPVSTTCRDGAWDPDPSQTNCRGKYIDNNPISYSFLVVVS